MKYSKKWIALLLILVMTAMPLLSLASTTMDLETEALQNGRKIKSIYSMKMGSLFDSDQDLAMIKDLINATSLHTETQMGANGAYSKLNWYLNNKDSLEAMLTADADSVYISSSLMGTTVLKFTQEDMLKAVEAFYDAYLNLLTEQMAQAGASPAVIEEYTKSIKEFWQAMLSGDEEIISKLVPETEFEMPEFDFDGENFSQQINALMQEIQSSMTEIKREPLNEQQDDFVLVQSFQITPEQLTQFVKIFADAFTQENNVNEILKFFNEGFIEMEEALTKDDVINTFKSLPDMFDTNIASYFKKPIVLTGWLDENGDLTAMEIATQIAPEGTEEAYFLDVTLDYHRATGETGVTRQINALLTNATAEIAGTIQWLEGVPVIAQDSTNTNGGFQAYFYGLNPQNGEMLFEAMIDHNAIKTVTENNHKEEWNVAAQIAMEGETSGIGVQSATNIDLNGLDFESINNTNISISSNGMTMPILSIQTQTASTAPGDMPVFKEEPVRIMNMTQEELAAWQTDMEPQLMTGLALFVQNMPPSIQSFIIELIQENMQSGY